MTHHNKPHETNTAKRKRVFVTHAQVLSEDQRNTLSAQEKAYETACHKKGVWLEVFCPDDACFREEERVRVPVFCEDPKAKKSLWLDVFCPESSCEVDASTGLS
jgi:hypothetical protein